VRPVAYTLRKAQVLRICNRICDWAAMQTDLDDPEYQGVFAKFYLRISTSAKGVQRVNFKGWGNSNASMSIA